MHKQPYSLTDENTMSVFSHMPLDLRAAVMFPMPESMACTMPSYVRRSGQSMVPFGDRNSSGTSLGVCALEKKRKEVRVS